MKIRTDQEVVKVRYTTTLTLTDSETKLLACLIGALSPYDAEELIKNAMYYEIWLGELIPNEVSDLVVNLYEGLYAEIINRKD